MPFTDDWSSTFKDDPGNIEDASVGAQRIREVRRAVEERMQVDHYWGDSSSNEGKHEAITLRQQGSDPVPTGNDSSLYAKDDGSGDEALYYINASGELVQITSGNALYDVVTLSGGGLIADDLILENNVYLKGQEVDTTEQNLIGISAGDTITLGAGGLDMTAFGIDFVGQFTGNVDIQGATVTLNGDTPISVEIFTLSTLEFGTNTVKFNNGLLLMWGKETNDGGDTRTITLPYSYASAVYHIGLTVQSDDAAQITVDTQAADTFQIFRNENKRFFWFTLGLAA